MRKNAFLLSLTCLTACTVGEITPNLPAVPKDWLGNRNNQSNKSIPQDWWKQFQDDDLDWLVDQTLKESPDINQAAAKIKEARGLQKTAFSYLFPNISGTAGARRSKQLQFGPITGNSYDAGFDASYELDLFGKNRENSNAAEAESLAIVQDHNWVKLSIIAEVVRTYILIRSAEKQACLAQKNLELQTETLELVKRQNQAGVSSEFDVERTALLVNQSIAQITNYKRQQQEFTLALVTLTGLTAETIAKRLVPHKTQIPGLDLAPVVDTPATVLSQRPDIAAANLRFEAATHLKKSQIATFFPTLSLSSMFGLSKISSTNLPPLLSPSAPVLHNSATVWSMGVNATVSLLDFGRIQGQIDAASAREVQAYEAWRKTILQGIQDVETALANAVGFNEQKYRLALARDNAAQAVALAQKRYKQGDISLLDVLDTQRQQIEVNKSLVEADSNYVISIVALYKAIGQH